MPRKPLRIMAVAEIAELIGTNRQAASRVTTRADFPPPAATIRAGKIWLSEDVEKWFTEHPVRPPGRPRKEARRGKAR